MDSFQTFVIDHAPLRSRGAENRPNHHAPPTHKSPEHRANIVVRLVIDARGYLPNEKVQPREGLARGVPRTTRDNSESSAATTCSDSRALTSDRGSATRKLASNAVSLLTPNGGVSKLAIRPRRVKYRRQAWRSVGFIFDKPPDPSLAAGLRRRLASCSLLIPHILRSARVLSDAYITDLCMFTDVFSRRPGPNSVISINSVELCKDGLFEGVTGTNP